MTDVMLMLAAAFAAGGLNAVAGGGSFLTLPALVAVGLAPAVANATGTLALLPGYLLGAWAFRTDIRSAHVPRLPLLLAACALGGALGAALLVWTPPDVFRRVVPWLLLVATALFWLAPRLLRGAHARHLPARGVQIGLAGASVYGGYFNGGIGIVLLALFGLAGRYGIHAMNGLKNLFSAVLTAIAVIVYVGGQLIHWPSAWIMMLAAAAGGYAGGQLARRLPAALTRIGVILLGLVMTARMFYAA